MADAVKVFLLTLSALFPIVDPLAGSPIFLAMTEQYPEQTRRALAWRVASNSLLLMVGSYFIGAHVLNFFGVSLPVVQVGGGLVVISMGWSMLVEKEETHETARKNVQCADALHSAFYPLTLPLTVGPEIDIRCGHAGRKLDAALWIPHRNHRCGARRHGRGRSERFALLWTGRPACPNTRQDSHDSHCEAFVVSAGLHWRADHVERNQRIAIIIAFLARGKSQNGVRW